MFCWCCHIIFQRNVCNLSCLIPSSMINYWLCFSIWLKGKSGMIMSSSQPGCQLQFVNSASNPTVMCVEMIIDVLSCHLFMFLIHWITNWNIVQLSKWLSLCKIMTYNMCVCVISFVLFFDVCVCVCVCFPPLYCNVA